MSILETIRSYLTIHNVQAIYIPKGDMFQGEYIQASDEKLAFVSGFTGSAGYAVITQTKALLCVDGRYTLQAKQEVDCRDKLQAEQEVNSAHWTIGDLIPLKTLLRQESIESVTFDPWLLTIEQYERLKDSCKLVPFDSDPFDLWWVDRPKRPKEKAFTHLGSPTADKLESFNIPKPFLVTSCENLCWLLNLRGHDVPYTPLLHMMGIIDHDKIHIYVDLDKMGVKGDFEVHPFEDFAKDIKHYETLYCDPKLTPYALKPKNPMYQTDPITRKKACKDAKAQQGMIDAHKRDAVAVINTLHWIDTHSDKPSLREKDVIEYVLQERQKQDKFHSLSFSTIAASGPNAAIVHYHRTERHLIDSLFLMDSGGQYLDGTTDITRTVPLAPLTQYQKKRFTQVLKGHIALSRAIFPKGTTGAHLDVLARQYLWAEGADYAHGTGHGVGSFLCVHEGPQRISKMGFEVPLEVGMVVSNEPGYYEEDAFGIRHENLELVIESDFKGFLCFKTLTLVPFDTRAVDFSILNIHEKEWLQIYHDRIKKEVGPFLEAPILEWTQRF